MKDLLKDLNSAQVEAVEHGEGPLLILAGAGSGKTKVLTHRIANLIVNKSILPSEILAVTFTNKAAKEMRNRLAELTQDSPENRLFMPWMGTFHGICVRLLRIDGAAIGVDSKFIIYDEDDRQGLVKQVMKQLSISRETIKPKAASSAISNAKNQMISPSDYAASARYPFQQAIAEIYAQYEKAKKDSSALDFDDLLLEAVALLKKQPEIKAKWRQQFKYVLVDEYQDTNTAQYQLIKLLSNDKQNVCVVGDDWQSIYSWRGADFTNILNFERDFPGAKVIRLEQNYRSTKPILDAAQQVITKNKTRSDKNLWTAQPGGLPVCVKGVYDDAEESLFVAQTIFKKMKEESHSFSDFSVLYRTNAQSREIERALIRFSLPYQIVGGVRFYDRKIIRDIIAYLKLIYQPSDRVSFARIANVPKRGLGETSLNKFLIWQAESGLDVISALNSSKEDSTLTPRAKKALTDLGSVLRKAQALVEDNISPSEIIKKILEWIDYRSFVFENSPKDYEIEQNLGSLVSDAQSFVDLGGFLEEVSLMASSDTKTNAGAITLMTIHAAKGLEFKVVFLVGADEGVLPSTRAIDAGDKEIEEERRLCYVAMTRARAELYLVHAQMRTNFGMRNYFQPSRFLRDAGLIDETAENEASFGSEVHDSYVEEFETQPFEIGDTVRSAQFGEGEVVDIDGMAVSVKFDSGQLKKLNVQFARLEKI